MAPGKLNQRNLAIHNLLMGENNYNRPIESIIAKSDTPASNLDRPEFAEDDRFRQVMIASEQQRKDLTEENLARHNSTVEMAKRLELTAENLARLEVVTEGSRLVPQTTSTVTQNGNEDASPQQPKFDSLVRYESDYRTSQGQYD